MGITSLMLASILLATGPAQTNDVVPINKRNFKIPILIEPSKRAQIKLLKLFVSSDQGQSWSESATRTPDQDHFAFYAPADGIYWFTVAVVDQRDHQMPPDPYKIPPNQKILVDTIGPDVKVSAEREGEEIAVNWEIKEEHPDWESLKLEYRAADAQALTLWTAIPMTRALTGKTKFRLDNPAAINVRMEMKDEAGNLSSVQKLVPAGSPNERITVAPPNGPAPLAVPPAGTAGGTGVSPLLNTSGNPQPMPPGHLPTATADRLPNAVPASGATGGLPGESGTRLAAWSANADPAVTSSAAPSSSGAGGSLPNVMVVSDTQISLEYEVKFGPSGVGKVQLYLTEDDGKSWRPWVEDENKKSPMIVKLPGQGVFGLRMVTTSGAGLSEGPPQPGDMPEIRVEVDTTPPVVLFGEPAPDPQHPDAIILSWSATDRNLGTKPVTIEFAEPGGPWHVIAANQPGTGSLSWQMTRPLARVNFRVTAIDMAGNASVAETKEPKLVDTNKTKARIVGIAPKRP
jgi:hypothetical protein